MSQPYVGAEQQPPARLTQQPSGKAAPPVRLTQQLSSTSQQSSTTSLLGTPTPTRENSKRREQKAREQREAEEAEEAAQQARELLELEAIHLPYQSPPAWKAVAKEVRELVSSVYDEDYEFGATWKELKGFSTDVCYLAQLLYNANPDEVVSPAIWLLQVTWDDDALTASGGDMNGAALHLLEQEGGELAAMARLTKLSRRELNRQCKQQGYQTDAVEEKMELVWLLTTGRNELTS